MGPVLLGHHGLRFVFGTVGTLRVEQRLGSDVVRTRLPPLVAEFSVLLSSAGQPREPISGPVQQPPALIDVVRPDQDLAMRSITPLASRSIAVQV